MTDGVSSRHRDDLGGQLGSWAERRPLRVQLRLGASASEPGVQHLAWMLVNLLARMDGVVETVYVDSPAVGLAEHVVPSATADRLDVALLDGAGAIDVVPVEPGIDLWGPDLVLELGPGDRPERGLRVHGDGWTGALVAAELPPGRRSPLPFGPYVAACLAAARVFLLARAPEVAVEEDHRSPLAWSTWSLSVGGSELLGDGPAEIDAVLDAGLAGVGAVGSAALHALWAAPGVSGRLLAVDGDRDGVDVTNLNRGVLFVRSSIGRRKAVEAADRLDGGELYVDPRQGRYEEQADAPQLLLSAVDTNAARAALQVRYPARIVGASTHGLRAELLRAGPPGRGPCLRCHNEPEEVEPDAALRRRLREADAPRVTEIAARAGVSVEAARRWAAEGRCGTVDAAMLSTLARERRRGPAEFAVAFVSAFAGTALAGEAVKESIGAEVPLDDHRNRATFQFFRPRALNGARFVALDSACPICAGLRGAIWRRRRDAWGPARRGRRAAG